MQRLPQELLQDDPQEGVHCSTKGHNIKADDAQDSLQQPAQASLQA